MEGLCLVVIGIWAILVPARMMGIHYQGITLNEVPITVLW